LHNKPTILFWQISAPTTVLFGGRNPITGCPLSGSNPKRGPNVNHNEMEEQHTQADDAVMDVTGRKQAQEDTDEGERE
jgi:hypothetical protein